MPDDGDLSDVARIAAARLEAGEILAHPTSTVYGLGAAATRELDVELARLKGRSWAVPLIRLAASPASIVSTLPGVRWDDRCATRAEAFWPGPLTVVVDDGSERGVAVRVDPHPLVLAILDRFDGLMSSTSLNSSGAAPARTPAAVREALHAMPASPVPSTFLDAGPLAESRPSTIVSLLGARTRLLRSGALQVEEIERLLGHRLEEGSPGDAPCPSDAGTTG